MAPQQQRSADWSTWLRLLYNHNPFYVVSAALVLYGLNESFSERFEPTHGWLWLKVLGGYTLLLAAAGVLIVRVARVWDDARTVILTTLLLLVALSSSFDRICLDSTGQAAQLLTAGFVGAVGLTVLFPWALGIRLHRFYQVLLVLHWLLFFGYPLLLGWLSLTGRDRLMSWLVLSFPTAGALLFLPLLHPIRANGRREPANGTPWSWPWYPAPIFIFLALGYAVRAYGLSASFTLAQGFLGGFEPYFLIPLLLVGAVLLRELSVRRGKLWLSRVLVWLPLVLIGLALPGPSQSAAQEQYRLLLRDSIGPPIFVTLAGLFAYYGHLAWRRARMVEPIVLGLLVFTSLVNEHTVSFNTLTSVPQAWIVSTVWLWLVITGLRWPSTWRLGVAGATFVLTYVATQYAEWSFEQSSYVILHGPFLFLYGLTLFMRDAGARYISRWATRVVTPVAAYLAIVAPFWWSQVPAMHQAAVLCILAGLALAHWAYRPTLRKLDAAIRVASIATLFAGWHLTRDAVQATPLRGGNYVAVGLGMLVLAVGVSLSKGGGWSSLQNSLWRLHRQRLRIAHR